MRHRFRLPAALVAITLAAVACGGSDEGSQPGPSERAGVATTLADFSIKPAEEEGAAGAVTFDLENEGPSDHTFFVIRTDLAQDALPVEDHVVQLSGLDVVGQVDDVPVDAAPALTVDLTAGDYVLICNYPGHYESDMHAAFAVTTPA